MCLWRRLGFSLQLADTSLAETYMTFLDRYITTGVPGTLTGANITSLTQVLSQTPSADKTSVMYAYIDFETLFAAAGDMTIEITVGGFVVGGNVSGLYPYSNDGDIRLITKEFIIRATETVVIDVQSPNANDTSVDVTAYLVDRDPLHY